MLRLLLPPKKNTRVAPAIATIYFVGPDDGPIKIGASETPRALFHHPERCGRQIPPLAANRWDEVFSEICGHLGSGSILKMHVRQHPRDS